MVTKAGEVGLTAERCRCTHAGLTGLSRQNLIDGKRAAKAAPRSRHTGTLPILSELADRIVSARANQGWDAAEVGAG